MAVAHLLFLCRKEVGAVAEERGVYKHKTRARQLLLFDWMQYGNITPTDIDMTIEYKDRARIFVEVKGRTKDVPIGQRLLLQRFVDDFRASGKDAIAIIAEHEVDDSSKDIHIKDCSVREIYYKKRADDAGCNWRKPHGAFTVKQLADAFIELNT